MAEAERQVELSHSVSSFSVSPTGGEGLDFLRCSFYCDQQGAAAVGGASARPCIAQGESDSDSELRPPSPDRGWAGTQ